MRDHAPVVSLRSRNKSIWERAAEIRGLSLTDFVSSVVDPVAMRIVAENAVADRRPVAEESAPVR